MKTFPVIGRFLQEYVEKCETVEKACLRELKEETGLKGEIVRTGESFSIEIPRVIINPVLVKVENDEVELSQEHTEYKWVDKNDLTVLKTVPKLKQDLEKLGIK